MPTHNPDDMNQVTAPVDLALKMPRPRNATGWTFGTLFPSVWGQRSRVDHFIPA